MRGSDQQVAARLIAALEVLARDEAAALETGDLEALGDIQDRAAVVVERLGTVEGLASHEAHSRRLAAVEACRARTAELLDAQITLLRENLREARATERRMGQVAPAYGRAAAPGGRSRLSVSG